jgi:hypothetical protein
LAAQFENSHSTGSYGVVIKAGDDSGNYALSVRNKDNGELMRVLGDGNVGIGIAAPSYLLSVEKSVSGLISRIYNTQTSGEGLLIRSGETANAERVLQVASRNDTKILTVNSNGRVGIGTTAPGTPLEISRTGNGSTLRLTQTSTTSFAEIHFNTDTEAYIFKSSSGYASYGGANALNIYGDASTPIAFHPGGNTNAVFFATSGNVGIGTATPSYTLEVNGSFGATTKSFIIDHPTKPDKKLQYASLEGPEHGVYLRGRSQYKVIDLPDYWPELVHEDSITVQLTPVGKHQSLYVEKIENNKVYINSNKVGEILNYFYNIYAERKDVAKLEVEIDK